MKSKRFPSLAAAVVSLSVGAKGYPLSTRQSLSDSGPSNAPGVGVLGPPVDKTYKRCVGGTKKGSFLLQAGSSRSQAAAVLETLTGAATEDQVATKTYKTKNEDVGR